LASIFKRTYQYPQESRKKAGRQAVLLANMRTFPSITSPTGMTGSMAKLKISVRAKAG